MKKINRILSALLLILAIVFNTASCAFLPLVSDGQSSVGDNTDKNPENTPDSDDSNPGIEDGGNTGDSGNTDDSDDYVFGEEYPTISIAEALSIAEGYTSSASTEKYYLIATVSVISSLKNGEMTITDGVDSIYVYRSTDASGASLSSSDLAVGDILIIYGTLRNYKGTLELEKAQIIDFYTPGVDVPARPDDGDNDDNTGSGDTEIGGTPGENVGGSLAVDEQARAEFYGDSDPADSYEEALQRSKQGILSGATTVPAAAPNIAGYRPTQSGSFIRNSNSYYVDDNTYVVVNAYGLEVFRVYRGGGYITLDEVAAYVYAFGDVPANYVSSKNTKPTSSIWGEYLRLNHSAFSGSTTNYPYEPELPNISGCGGYMYYYEIDIGTTGTDTGNGYEVRIYNNGTSIVRGAARIVYTFSDYDRDGVVENDEKYVFYTYNHYNDFQEYLNYYGGWGKMFGNVTGGGTLSSKYDYNPTPYIPTILAPISAGTIAYADSYVEEICIVDIYYCIASKKWLLAA